VVKIWTCVDDYSVVFVEVWIGRTQIHMLRPLVLLILSHICGTFGLYSLSAVVVIAVVIVFTRVTYLPFGSITVTCAVR